MNLCAITGSTGYIGVELCKHLAEQKYQVRALCRSTSKAKTLLSSPEIECVEGDILDYEPLLSAFENCETVFHLAAFAKVWSKNNQDYHQINVDGTLNAIKACIAKKVKRLVIVSTAGVFGHSENGQLVTEESLPAKPLSTQYEKTKKQADQEAEKYLDQLEIIWVHPTRVYGPGQLSESNAATRLIERRMIGKMKFVPSHGNQKGNYIFIGDLVKGIRQAAEKGNSGEHYLLGGNNVSYKEFYEEIDLAIGKTQRIIGLPLWLMKLVSYLELAKAEIFGTQPLITPPFVNKYNYNWNVSHQKASTELGYKPISLSKGIKRTVIWLKDQQKTATH
ncbi:MAG: NAD-dependent epimerase/dehydratase family protein [Bacteroidetes bacterium]|nr:NAD-dependent epimerase/dehydratase family protein [Bacteroidota bacterium]